MTPKLFAPLSDLKQPSADDFYDHCQVGHQTHARTIVFKNIGGVDVTYQIYDWREYFITVDDNETVSEHGQYCTGQDIISYCIDRQGIWEIEETALQLDILSEHKRDSKFGTPHDALVLDFGSHIGYYSILAALKGYRVAAFDSSRENLALLHESAQMNQVTDKIYPYLCLLDGEVPKLSGDAEDIQLAKVDIEGAERYALQMMTSVLMAHKVKYLIMEISPTFNDSYPDIVELICSWDYDVYQIPTDKNWEHYTEFMAAPLATLKKHCAIPGDGRRDYVAGLHQENFVFIRRDG